jgi:hypothetical protein
VQIGYHRFDEEAIGSDIERKSLVGFAGVSRRVENRRDIGSARIGAHGAAELEAVHFRHQDIADDEVEILAVEFLQRFHAVSRGFQRMSLCR